SSEHDFDAAFTSLRELRAGALVIGTDAFFISRGEQLALLAARYAVPTIFQYREFAAAGGLASYGGSGTDPTRQVGIYTGRILKGEKPADLPVQQEAKVELIVNLKAHRSFIGSVSRKRPARVSPSSRSLPSWYRAAVLPSMSVQILDSSPTLSPISPTASSPSNP